MRVPVLSAPDDSTKPYEQHVQLNQNSQLCKSVGVVPLSLLARIGLIAGVSALAIGCMALAFWLVANKQSSLVKSDTAGAELQSSQSKRGSNATATAEQRGKAAAPRVAKKSSSPPAKKNQENKQAKRRTRTLLKRPFTTESAALQKELQLLSAGDDRSALLDWYALHAPAKAEESIASLAKHLQIPAANDGEKARLIFRWITDRIAYDAKAFFANNYGDPSAEVAFKRRKCVCSGYSNLFKALCDQMGVECQPVTGYLRGYGYKPGDPVKANHAWNSVKIDGIWHLLDATLGAGYLNRQKQFVKKTREFFFLPKPELFVLTHFPDKSKWQLLSSPLTRKEHRRLPKVNRDLFKLFPQLASLKEIRRLAGAKEFRGFADMHASPRANIVVHKGPPLKYLKTGAKHQFRIESDIHDQMAIIQGKKWHHLTRTNNIFEGAITARPGELIVAGHLSDDKSRRFWDILVYQVK